MLQVGRKIISDHLLHEAREPIESKVAGLNIAGLRIHTDNATLSNTPFKERTNTAETKDFLTAGVPSSGITPNTSYTFGVPNPTTILPPPRAPPTSLRHLRYSLAEQQLANSFQHCAREPSPQELQIRALERITAFLSARAQEAQESAEKLRACLADREVEPQAYEALQRERWMEERRGRVADEEVKVVQQLLTSLSQSHETQPISSPHTEPKSWTNLAIFFARSSTKTSASSRRASPIWSVDYAPRRMTIRNATPMRLRTKPDIPLLTQPLSGRLRSAPSSRKRKTVVSPRNSSIRTPGPSNRGSMTFQAVAEDVGAGANLPTLSSWPAAPSASLSRADDIYAINHFYPLLEAADSSTAVADGTATIFVPAARRTKDEILADPQFQGDQASLPAYAVDLIDDLDFIDDSIPLLACGRPAAQSRSIVEFKHESLTSLPTLTLTLPAPAPPEPQSPRPSTDSSRSRKRWSILKRPSRRRMIPLVSIPEVPFTPEPSTATFSAGLTPIFFQHRGSQSASRVDLAATRSTTSFIRQRPSRVSLDSRNREGILSRLRQQFSILGRNWT